MAIKIKRKRALRELGAMVDALNTCAPEDIYITAIGAVCAHFYAYRIGILEEASLDVLSDMIVHIANERIASNEAEKEDDK